MRFAAELALHAFLIVERKRGQAPGSLRASPLFPQRGCGVEHLEAFGLDRDAIDSDREIGHDEIAVVVGSGLPLHRQRCALNQHVRVGHDRSLLVGDAA